MKRPQKRKLEKDSPYLEYDKGFNHACMLWEKFIKECTEFSEQTFTEDDFYEPDKNE